MKNKKIFLIGLVLIFFTIFIPVTKVFSHSKNEHNWYFVPNGKNAIPLAPKETAAFLEKNDAFFLGNSNSKDLFLTFDEGYENGNTPKILDILKEVDVKAAFFVVKPYIENQSDLVKRMVDEGHLVCNHSSKHLSMPALSDETFKKEFKETEIAYENLIHSPMPKFFRPPMGKYSEESLVKTKELGYKTIFWSFAYKDWLIDCQPSPEDAYKKILSSAHPGSIMLLHAVSNTNVQILKDVLLELKSQGYTFKTLNEL